MGAKTKYDKNTFPLLGEQFARNGLSDVQIAKSLGVSHQSYYDYQKKYIEFFDAIKRGKSPVNVKVENALYKRATGYSYEEKHTEYELDKTGQPKPSKIKIIKKEVAPDVGAIAFWLKNRMAEDWRDKQEIEATIKTELSEKELDKRIKELEAKKENKP